MEPQQRDTRWPCSHICYIYIFMLWNILSVCMHVPPMGPPGWGPTPAPLLPPPAPCWAHVLICCESRRSQVAPSVSNATLPAWLLCIHSKCRPVSLQRRSTQALAAPRLLAGCQEGQEARVHNQPLWQAPRPAASASGAGCSCPTTKVCSLATQRPLPSAQSVRSVYRQQCNHLQSHTTYAHAQQKAFIPCHDWPLPECMLRLCTGSGLARVWLSSRCSPWDSAWHTGIGAQGSMLRTLKSQRCFPAPAAYSLYVWHPLQERVSSAAACLACCAVRLCPLLKRSKLLQMRYDNDAGCPSACTVLINRS